jgi:hypothetical protein
MQRQQAKYREPKLKRYISLYSYNSYVSISIPWGDYAKGRHLRLIFVVYIEYPDNLGFVNRGIDSDITFLIRLKIFVFVFH